MTIVVGPPDAPAIVFVHGSRMTGSMWTAQVAGLSGEFRTIVMDLPAHGTRAAERFTLSAAMDALSTTIGEEADGRAVVVGLSLGGYVAMALAAREPERIRGLVLAGATAEPVGVRMLPFLVRATVMDRIDPRHLDRLDRWFFRTRYESALADPIIAGGFWSAGGAEALRCIVGERFAARLAAYPGPTLIINGEYDLPFRLSARTFAAAAGNARRIRLAGATHLSNLDRPADFNEAVRRFARALDPA